jgi:hypothetical protein
MATKVLKEYDTTLDTKHRFTLRGVSKQAADYKNYHVKIYDDGKIVMEPRVLVDPKLISKRTLQMMDRGIKNFSKGKVSEPLDIKKLKGIADALPD